MLLPNTVAGRPQVGQDPVHVIGVLADAGGRVPVVEVAARVTAPVVSRHR